MPPVIARSVRPLLLATLALLCAAAPAATHALPPSEAVRRELADLARRPGAADAAARLLQLAPALDALPVAEQAAALDRLARSAAPAVAARAQLLSLRHLRDAAARAAARQLGFITDWRALGPLAAPPAAPTRAHADLPTLPAPGSDASAEGLFGPVTWTRLTDHGPPGGTSVDALLPSDGPAVVHLAATVTSPARRAVLLRLGGGGALAVSLNGQALGAARALAFPVPDQLQARATLRPGDNHLVLTLARDAGAPAAIYARFTDLQGRPLPDLQTTATALASSLPAPAADAPTARLSVDAALAVGGPSPLAFDRALLQAAARRRLGLPDLDTGVDAADDADAAAPPLLEDLLLTDAAVRLPADRLLLALAHVPREEARASILLHLEANGRREPALRLTLAQLAAAQGQSVRARLLLAEVSAADDPDVRRLHRLVASRADRLDGEPEAAWSRLAPDRATPDADERVVVEALRAALELGRPDEAARLAVALVAAAPGDVEHRATLAQAQAASGDSRAAIDALAELARLRPDRPGYALLAARTALARADEPRARRLLDAAAAQAGLDPDVLESVGRLRLELGDTPAAVAAFERALRVRPANPDLRAALERLTPAADAALPFEVAVDAALLARPSRAPDAAFEVLAEEVHVQVHPDGTTSRLEQRVVRVHRVPEDRAARSTQIRFDPTQQQVRVLDARVHRGGLSLPVLEREVAQISESWYGLYYDLRELSVPFDDLQPGDVIAVRHRVDSVGRPLIAGAVDLLEVLQDTVPKHRLVLTVSAPADLPLASRLVVPPGVSAAGATVTEAREPLADGRVRWRVDGRDLPPLPLEPAMPGAAEVAALWQATTFASWAEVVERYLRLVRPQQVVTPAMRRWVEAQTEAARTSPTNVSEALLVRRVVESVTRDIRYVGLEFGIHGYQPYRTDQVWTRRFGDCKDQATLLVTLLGLAGVDARVALVRTRRLGRVPEALPTLAAFDHAIVWLPDRDLYVDPTARTFGLGELPALDQGAQVLILDPDVPQPFRQSPSDAASRSGVDGEYTVALRDDGAAGLRGLVAFRGSQAPGYRERLADADARTDRLEELLNGRYPGLQLASHAISDPSDRARPLELSFTAEAPRVAARVGATLQVPRPAGADGFASRLASEARRVHAVVLGPPATHRFKFRYVLPPGWRPEALPASAQDTSRFGRYSVHWRLDAGAPVVETHLELAVDQVAPQDYSDFRAFMQAFDQAIRPPLVLVFDPPARQAAP